MTRITRGAHLKTKQYDTTPLEAFEIWYANERSWVATVQKTAVPERTLYAWRDKYKWVQEADLRDRMAQEAARKAAVKRRADMIKRHADIGRGLQGKAIGYLNNQEMVIESASDAVYAAKTGIDIERQAEGMPEHLIQILNMSDDELMERYDELNGTDIDPGVDAGANGSGSGNETARPVQAPGDHPAGDDE